MATKQLEPVKITAQQLEDKLSYPKVVRGYSGYGGYSTGGYGVTRRETLNDLLLLGEHDSFRESGLSKGYYICWRTCFDLNSAIWDVKQVEDLIIDMMRSKKGSLTMETTQKEIDERLPLDYTHFPVVVPTGRYKFSTLGFACSEFVDHETGRATCYRSRYLTVAADLYGEISYRRVNVTTTRVGCANYGDSLLIIKHENDGEMIVGSICPTNV